MTDHDQSTAPTPEEDALYRSLLETVVDFIGQDHISQVTVEADLYTGAAQVSICLLEESWDTVTHAIERMGQVRMMFMDELSIEYSLTSDEHCMPLANSSAKDLVYV